MFKPLSSYKDWDSRPEGSVKQGSGSDVVSNLNSYIDIGFGRRFRGY